MDFKTFLENFDAIAEAPGGIPKLRSLILDLAVRGKLVPQNSEDEPASVLIEKIKTEKHSKGIKTLNLPTSAIDEISKDIPQGWAAEYLINLVLDFQNGISKRSSNEGELVPVLRLADIKDGQLSEASLREIALTSDELNKYRVANGDILVIRVNGSANLVGQFIPCFTKRDWAYSDHLIRARLPLEFINQKYLCIFSKTQRARTHIAGKTITTAGQKTVNQNGLSSLPVLLPPLAEQKRIVEKVDELMGLCDRYEAAKQTRDNLRQKLRESAIASLMNAETDEELDAAWAIVRDNWCEVSQYPEDVDNLRQFIFELAVKGKVVSQNYDDEPVEKSLNAIALERTQLVKEGKLRKNQATKAKVFDESQFSVPYGWKVVQAEDAFLIVTDGDHQPPPKADDGISFLVISNVSKGYLDFSQTRFVPQEYFENLDWSKKPKKNDILYTVTGSYGIPLIVDTDQAFCVQRHIAILKTSDSLDKEYLKIALSSSSAKRYAHSVATGIAQKTVPLSGLRSLPIPLPPLAEQKRIVTKVNELMKLCDQLEASLRQSQQRAESLAASAISHLTI